MTFVRSLAIALLRVLLAVVASLTLVPIAIGFLVGVVFALFEVGFILRGMVIKGLPLCDRRRSQAVSAEAVT